MSDSDAALTARRSRSAAAPPALREHPYATLGVFVLALVFYRLVGPFGSTDVANANLINTWLFYTVIVIGFYFIFGLSGQFAFSQAVMAAIGGYVSAWASRVEPLGLGGFVTGLVCGMIAAGIVAALFALAMRRAGAFYLAIGTLALSTIVLKVLTLWTDFTGATGDTTSGIAGIRLFGIQISGSELRVSEFSPDPVPFPLPVETVEYRTFWVWLSLFVIVMLMAIWIARSPAKRETLALRDQPTVARTLGVPVQRIRITSFVLGSVVAAAAGSVFVHSKTFASPDAFDLELGLGVFVMLILGGIDSKWGPAIGAFFYVFVPQWLQGGVLGIPGPSFTVTVHGQELRASNFSNLFFGALLIIVMIAFPEGLAGIGHRVRSKLRRRTGSTGGTWLSERFGLRRRTPPASGEAVDVPETVDAPSATPDPTGADVPADIPADISAAAAVPEEPRPVLTATDISVTFGGVRAVDGVSLTLLDGEILGVIGPNGSGKTTFLNALTGVVEGTGSIEIDGADHPVGKLRSLRRFGVVRTYQAPQTYEDMSCLEDVMLSTPDRAFTGFTASWLARPWVHLHERARWRAAVRALDRVGLAPLAEQSTRRLSYGQRRLLELARAIAAEPRMLLLDEPSAGLNASETLQLARHLRRLRDEHVAMILVDHKLDFMTAVCDRIAVLELGRLVAIGTSDTVFDDPRVVDAYLGVDASSDAAAAPATPGPDQHA